LGLPSAAVLLRNLPSVSDLLGVLKAVEPRSFRLPPTFRRDFGHPLDFVTVLCYTNDGGGSMLSFGGFLVAAHWPPEVLAKLLSPEKTSFPILNSSTCSGKSQGARRRVHTTHVFLAKPVLPRRKGLSRPRHAQLGSAKRLSSPGSLTQKKRAATGIF